ncbi:MAG: helix-turn-helix transcriptional regulator [Trueperaceae bacterium]
MSAPTEYPTLTLQGRMYVVVPADDFAAMTGDAAWVPAGDSAPWSVVKRHLDEDVSMARAWREHLGLTQQEVAKRLGITQGGLSQIEKQRRPRKATVEKLAVALGVSVEQLRS